MISEIPMHTRHRIHFSDSRHMEAVPDESIELVVTSPPYPMIEMWDPVFAVQDPAVGAALKNGRPAAAFEGMHRILDSVWKEAFRVLKSGGVACINIGDAVRTLNGDFDLYPNHSRILSGLQHLGFTLLPCILWRKQTNAPTKFMGSGMLPPGAHVTLEHEYILIARKGPLRKFKTDAEKQRRRESAFFWEERNVWFSDIWMDLKGTSQDLSDKNVRDRSGAFPFELAYRLIAMFSIKEDTVLDPFLGLGTTLSAAIPLARNSIGYEIDPGFKDAVRSRVHTLKSRGNRRTRERIQSHLDFVHTREQAGKPLKHRNVHYGFPVVSRQETALFLEEIVSIQESGTHCFEVTYAAGTTEEMRTTKAPAPIEAVESKPNRRPMQRTLFNE